MTNSFIKLLQVFCYFLIFSSLKFSILIIIIS
nr:MAG TPA: hypothetical protein [Caudoviricetes sp.]